MKALNFYISISLLALAFTGCGPTKKRPKGVESHTFSDSVDVEQETPSQNLLEMTKEERELNKKLSAYEAKRQKELEKLEADFAKKRKKKLQKELSDRKISQTVFYEKAESFYNDDGSIDVAIDFTYNDKKEQVVFTASANERLKRDDGQFLFQYKEGFNTEDFENIKMNLQGLCFDDSESCLDLVVQSSYVLQGTRLLRQFKLDKSIQKDETQSETPEEAETAHTPENLPKVDTSSPIQLEDPKKENLDVSFVPVPSAPSSLNAEIGRLKTPSAPVRSDAPVDISKIKFTDKERDDIKKGEPVPPEEIAPSAVATAPSLKAPSETEDSTHVIFASGGAQQNKIKPHHFPDTSSGLKTPEPEPETETPEAPAQQKNDREIEDSPALSAGEGNTVFDNSQFEEDVLYEKTGEVVEKATEPDTSSRPTGLMAKLLYRIQNEVFNQSLKYYADNKKTFDSKGRVTWIRGVRGKLKNSIKIKNDSRYFFTRAGGQQKDLYGSTLTKLVLEYAARKLADKFPTAKTCQHDISKKHGGRIEDHKSHRNGLDADVVFPTNKFRPEECSRNASARYSETAIKRDPKFLEINWMYINNLLETERVHGIFISSRYQKRLCKYAKKIGVSKEIRKKVFKKLHIQHGHDKHYHVRMVCNKQNIGCITQDELTGSRCD